MSVFYFCSRINCVSNTPILKISIGLDRNSVYDLVNLLITIKKGAKKDSAYSKAKASLVMDDE